MMIRQKVDVMCQSHNPGPGHLPTSNLGKVKTLSRSIKVLRSENEIYEGRKMVRAIKKIFVFEDA